MLIIAFRVGDDTVDLVERVVDDLAVGRRHRLERTRLAGADDLLGHLAGEATKRLAAPLAITTDVETQPRVMVTQSA
ncbi:MAG TPA: hypothetical protein PLV68_10595, partial [Ilumatobacteraceae bacterium]|nr:hypothetical protein [Ilumatobacteraceae bacterium]